MNKRGREVLSYSRVLINAEEMKRIKNHQLAIITEVADSGRYPIWMLELVCEGLMRSGILV